MAALAAEQEAAIGESTDRRKISLITIVIIPHAHHRCHYVPVPIPQEQQQEQPHLATNVKPSKTHQMLTMCTRLRRN